MLFNIFFIQFFANDFDFESFSNSFFINFLNLSLFSINRGDIFFFMDFHINSIGFRSGEYGGKNTKCILSFKASFIVKNERCELKLSKIRIISFIGLFFLIFLKKSTMHSFVDFSLKSTTLFPFIE